MRIVVATDSFKGSLTAQAAGDAIIRGIHRYNPDIKALNIPMADGGEGTVQSLVDATGGSLVTAPVHDPLMRPIEATYGILGCSDSNSTGPTAVIEMAAASGLPLLKPEEFNPAITTTYGTGELILHALDNGCRSFIIGLGGSATNDGGMGMLQALGVRFLDNSGQMLNHGGAALQHLDRIDTSSLDVRLKDSHFQIACDVDNPLCGKSGASAIYGPQKGATPEMVQSLDKALAHYAQIVERDFSFTLGGIPGAGAAGGVGAALLGFLDGNFHRGVDLVLQTVNLESAIESADLLITGEGKIDGQTRFGKTPYGVAQVAVKNKIPVIALCGMVGESTEILYEHGFTEIHGLVDSIVDNVITPEYAMQHGAELLEELAYRIIQGYIQIKEESIYG